MSTHGRIAAVILAIALGTSAPARATSSGDQLLDRETAARIEQVHHLIRDLTALDDALITAGKDDPVRQARIIRLIRLDSSWKGAVFESTAVLAAGLDDLARDPEIRVNPLFRDLERAKATALKLLIAGVAATRYPVSRDLEAMRLRLVFDAAADSLPIPPPPLARLPGGDRRLLEGTPLHHVPVPGDGCAGYRWLPGSRYVLSWDRRTAFVVDLEQLEAQVSIPDVSALPPPSISASGEYMAATAMSEGKREVRLFRLRSGMPPKALISGDRVDALSFNTGTLSLACLVDGNLNLYDVASGETRGIASGLEDGLRLDWSPDGSRLAVTPLATGARVRVFNTGTGIVEFEAAIAGNAPVWYADSRSLTSLALSEATGTERTPFLERWTVEGQGPDRVPIFPVGEHESIAGPFWSPDGRRAAFRVDVSDAAYSMMPPDGFPTTFLDWSSAIRVVHFDIPDSARYDPPSGNLMDFAWHPSGRWYAARHTLAGERRLWLHDAERDEALPLGGPEAARPSFSPDGGRVLWIDGNDFSFRNLDPLKENLTAGRENAATGARQLRDGHFNDAAISFRNAIRLAPKDARAYQGLGRAYMAQAFAAVPQVGAAPGQVAGRLSGIEALEVEAAVRAFARAVELDGSAADLRVDFLDAIGREAWLQGQWESRRLIQLAQDRLAGLPSPGDVSRRRYGAEIRALLVDAILWDPGNEYARILLDGVIARFPVETP